MTLQTSRDMDLFFFLEDDRMIGTIHLAVTRKGVAECASFAPIDLADFEGCHVVHVTFDDEEANDSIHSHVDWKEFARGFLGMLKSTDSLHIFEKWFLKVWNASNVCAQPKTLTKKNANGRKKKQRKKAAA